MKEEGTFIFKVHQFTKGDELYDFIKKEMTFEEVMKLYRLLQEDIEGQIDISKLIVDGETVAKEIKNSGDFHKKYYE